MPNPSFRALIVSATSFCAGMLALASCTHTGERVLEPVGGGDASTTVPEASDAGPSLIGPVARKPELEPPSDFRLVRSPELGLGARVQLAPDLGDTLQTQGGGAGSSGSGGGDRRPVSSDGGRGYF